MIRRALPRRHAAPLPLLFSLLLLMLLQGCSALKLAYKQADTLLYWRLDSYADFSDEQAPRVHEGLAQFLRWHQREQLPAYADLLQRLRPLMADAIPPEQACTLLEQVRGTLETSLDPAHWPLVWLATDLSEEQLRHIERKQASSDAEWKKEWITGVDREQLIKLRFEQVLSRSEMLYGRLGETQKAVIRAELANSVFEPQRNFAERQRRQQDLIQVLRKIRGEKLGVEAARVQLKGLMARSLHPPDPAYQRYSQALIREGCQTFARLHQATTGAQREKAAQTLKSYEDDFRLLAGQAKP